MAGIITNVGEDIKSLQQLRQEIENVKKALGSIDINVKIDIRKELEQRLQSLTKQYDSLVAKAAEADAKIMESAARMDKAVDSITKAHEKAEKVAMKQTSSAGTKTQTEAVEGQAKAYLDLKDEIDAILGTREQNIRQMMQEQNAIKLINAEIAQINKSRQSSGRISQTQAQRLQTLNDDLLMHRQALAEVRQELANNAKLDLAAVGSMNELSQSLSRMRIAYRALNEDERNSEFGQNLLKSIQEADAKIKELDATIGNHQRNVGNYQGSFNGLNMSVQQIVRELPSAKMGINMFFMAISNNLPIMADQIKLAKEANKAMKEAGQEPVPIWRQLVSSLFSWQSAMMVGITLLTVYGKDIANWVKELFKANDAQEQARKEAEAFTKTVQKAHEEWRNSVAQTAAQQITEYRKMQREWNKLGNDLNAKKKYVDANRDAFHQLGFAVNGVSDAERVMTGNTDAVVASIMARAKASAYYAQMQEATERYIKQTDYNKSTVKGGGYYERIKAGKTFFSTGIVPKELQGLKEGVHYTTTSNGTAIKFVLNAIGASEINSRRNQAAAKILAENQKKAKNQLDKQISSLQDGLEATVKENQGLLKKIGVSEYKDYEDRKEKQKKESVAKQVDYDKMAREQSEAERNLENAVAQSRIDAMQEGYEKEKKQRELNHKKELEDIDKQRRDFLQRKRDDAKRVFEADPKNKDKVFKTSSVTLSKDEQSKFNTLRENTEKKHVNEDKEAEQARINAFNDYLKEYGSMQEKRLAIAKEYDEKIAKAQSDGERLKFGADKVRVLSDFDIKVQKDAINWEDIFGNLDSFTKTQLESIKSKLRDMLSSKDLDLEGYKTAVEQIDRVNDAILSAEDKQRSFLGVSVTYNETRRKLEMDIADALQRQADATNQMSEAQANMGMKQYALGDALSNAGIGYEQKDLKSSNADAILKKVGDKNGVGSEKYKAVQIALDALAKSEREYNSIVQKKNKADRDAESKQSKLNKYLEDFAAKLQDLMPLFSQINDNLQDLPGLLGELGISSESSVGKTAANLANAGNAAMGAAADYMSGNYVGAAMKGISAIKSFGSALGIGSGNEKEVAKTTERLTKSNEHLAERIDDLSDIIGNSAGARAVNAYDTALKAQKEINKNSMEILKTQMGYHSAHHSNASYADDRKIASYNKDAQLAFKAAGVNASTINGLSSIYNLTPEQLKAIKDFAPDLWRYLTEVGKYDKSKYWDDVVEQAGKTEKLTEQIQDNITQTSFDSLRSGFLDTLMDMNADAEDWSKNFEKMLFKSFVSTNILNDEFNDWLKAFQEKWANKIKSGNMSNGDWSDYRDEYSHKMAEKKREVDAFAASVGYSETDSQKATINEARNLSEDTGSQIVGRLTAAQIAVESGNVKRDTANVQLSLMNAKIDDFKMTQIQTRDIADETRTILADSYLELKEINANTGNSAAHLKEIRSDIKDLKKIMDDKL
ncbi:hypothetical protein [Segatella buccae]|uniref:hypothetical protein n=1 Tax=Segatella buccae TaxID=28126 RepID=UPI0022E2D0C8|nr:hypothetical protein [Segatella buccae]